jgi:hypothetical protein
MKTEIENKKRLDELERKIKDYQTDFSVLKIEKDILENRIINLKTKITNLQSNED